MLFVVMTGQLAVQWLATRIAFVDHGDTRESIFTAYISGVPVLQVVATILSYCGNILADGILVSFY